MNTEPHSPSRAADSTVRRSDSVFIGGHQCSPVDALTDALEPEVHLYFAFTQHRSSAYGLLAHVLSRHADVPAGDWRFRRTRYGRPEIAAPAGSGLRFSLSYGQGLTAVAVARHCDLGVDLAWVQRDVDIHAIAEYAFAASELNDLRSRGRHGQRERFFAYWTLKEACTKARGTGLLPGRRTPCFSLRAGHVALVAEGGESTEGWRFVLGRAPLHHRWALAVHCGGAPSPPGAGGWERRKPGAHSAAPSRCALHHYCNLARLAG